MSAPVLHQTFACQIRDINESARTATFVAATEGGVDTWAGKEHLRMTGARLERYLKNPVVIDSHRTHESVLRIVGDSPNTRVSGRELIAENVSFADTDHANEVWKLVKGRKLRAMSIGFIPVAESILRLQQGQFDGEGPSRIEGPAVVVREWELIEISVVAVPADEDALRRALYQHGPEGQEDEMTAPAAPGKQPTIEPAKPAPASPAPAEAAREIPLEVCARELRARREVVMAFTPKGFEAVAERALLDGLDVEQARAAVRAAYDAKHKPIGTPEPPAPGAQRAAASPPAEGAKPSAEEITNLMVRAFLPGAAAKTK